MKFLVIVSSLLAISLAFPTDIAEVYLTEDTNGFYKFHIKSKAITRDETRDHDGKTVGDYTFVDPEGVHHKVSYVAAAEEGYNPNSADIPVAVPEGEEIVHARSEHLAAVDAERALHPEGIPEEKPVPLSEVLAKFVVPDFATLPAEAIPEENRENIELRTEHLLEYARVLESLAEEYKKAYA